MKQEFSITESKTEKFAADRSGKRLPWDTVETLARAAISDLSVLELAHLFLLRLDDREIMAWATDADGNFID